MLKLSGEALASSLSDETIDASTVSVSPRRSEPPATSSTSRSPSSSGVATSGGARQVPARDGPGASDIMGMLGTVINALALQDALEHERLPDPGPLGDSHGRGVRALYPPGVPFATSRKAASSSLRQASAIPTSPPTRPAALRAAEIEADAISKGTRSGVDGVCRQGILAATQAPLATRRSGSWRSCPVTSASWATRQSPLLRQQDPDPGLRPDAGGQYSLRPRRRADRYAD